MIQAPEATVSALDLVSLAPSSAAGFLKLATFAPDIWPAQREEYSMTCQPEHKTGSCVSLGVAMRDARWGTKVLDCFTSLAGTCKNNNSPYKLQQCE